MNDLASVSRQIAALRAQRDHSGDWPAAELEWLAAASAFGWMVPTQFGGTSERYDRLLYSYRTITAGSLAVALILTQRDGACDLIARSEVDQLPRELLPAHARGELFTSVGISQITTSKGAAAAKLRAIPDGDAFILSGFMPWVTGAKWCDQIVTAAVLDDGRQIVACINGDDPGLVIREPMQLLALDASQTSRVDCDAVRVSPDRLLRKPHETALAGRAPVKTLTVSAVGMGLADAIRTEIDKLRPRQPEELRWAIARLDDEFNAVDAQFAEAARQVAADGSDEGSPALRVAVNTLVTHLAIALVNLSKGSGFVRGHPAEQLVREAMFFQVWSSPPSTQGETLDQLLGRHPT